MLVHLFLVTVVTNRIGVQNGSRANQKKLFVVRRVFSFETNHFDLKIVRVVMPFLINLIALSNLKANFECFVL